MTPLSTSEQHGPSCERCEGDGSYSDLAPCTTNGPDCACNGPRVIVDPCPDCGGLSTSKLAQLWYDALEAQGAVLAQVSAERNLYHRALQIIRGPADPRDSFMESYAAAGGGYEGLQAIAEEALGDA